MDAEDHGRIARHLERLLAALQIKGVLTNVEVRAIAGSRGMGRVNSLQKMGHPITVRKLTGAIWEVRYNAPALARSAETPVAYPDADCGPLFRQPSEQGAFQR
jgi:hypothetical protein